MDVDSAVSEIDEAVPKHVGGEDEAFREHEQRPSSTTVEERTAEIIRDRGEAVPEDSPLQNV